MPFILLYALLVNQNLRMLRKDGELLIEGGEYRAVRSDSTQHAMHGTTSESGVVAVANLDDPWPRFISHQVDYGNKKA